MQQLEQYFPENHIPAAMTVPEWQLRARLKWMLQQQEQYQLSFLTATTPTALDLRRPINNTLSVLPAGTCNAFSMPPDLIHCPVFGSSFVSGGDEGASVAEEGGGEPGMSSFSCPPPAVLEEAQIMKATAAAAAAAPYHSMVDGSGRDQSSRKRKATHEAITEEERPEVDNGYDLDAMIVPKLETDPPISRSVTTTADGSDCTKMSDHTPAAKSTGYIHVRARRGQATDSHSLAERARREKISKRMKLLQELVPGCSRITGKAGVLDEIINYVQSLQRQVEFLSMKLAAVDPILDSDIDAFLSKEVMQKLNPHHGGLLPSSAGSITPPLELQLDASFLKHVNAMQTVQQAVAAPTGSTT